MGLQEPGKAAGEWADLRSYAETLETVLELSYEGIVVVDPDGMITMFNQRYADFLGIRREDAIGRHVTAVIENTRMHVVVKTGVPEVGHRQRIMGQDMVVQRIPIVKDGKIVGAVGKVMFQDINELKVLVERLDLLETKIAYYEKELRNIRGARYSFENIAGQSPVLLKAKNEALRAARSRYTVLIRGESGTGKELFAHAIHAASTRAAGPFIKVNCAAIPAEMLEAELFGYEEGAFTGARKGGKPGKFELAHRGTLFLDEIGDMPLAMQAKILRALQEKEIERLGSVEATRLDVRVVAATNKDLEKMVEAEQFREDLYYRLNVIPVYVPSLGERQEDLPLIVKHLMKQVCDEQGIREKRVTVPVLEIFREYHWPGNVRELLNLLERIATTVEGPEVRAEHLPPGFREKFRRFTGAGGKEGLLDQTLDRAEREAITGALQRTGGNRARAARLLGIHRSTLYDKMNKYGL